MPIPPSPFGRQRRNKGVRSPYQRRIGIKDEEAVPVEAPLPPRKPDTPPPQEPSAQTPPAAPLAATEQSQPAKPAPATSPSTSKTEDARQRALRESGVQRPRQSDLIQNYVNRLRVDDPLLNEILASADNREQFAQLVSAQYEQWARSMGLPEEQVAYVGNSVQRAAAQDWHVLATMRPAKAVVGRLVKKSTARLVPVPAQYDLETWQTASRIFGLQHEDHSTLQELATSVVGAPDNGAATIVYAGRYIPAFGDDPPLDGHGFRISIAAPELDKCVRWVGMTLDGHRMIRNEYISIKKEQQGSGLGTSIFANQVANAAEMGFDYIDAHAATGLGQHGSLIGAYTWPLLGYNAELENMANDPETARIAADIHQQFPWVRSMLELLAVPAEPYGGRLSGRAWWKEYNLQQVQNRGGMELHLKFDLEEGSRSRQVLAAYLEEAKRKRKAMDYAMDSTKPLVREKGQRPYEEIHLAPWQEEAADRAWQKLGSKLFGARGDNKGFLPPHYGHKAEEPTAPPTEPTKKPAPTSAPETAKEPAKVVPANLPPEPPEPEEPDSTVTTAPTLPGYGALQGLEQENPALLGLEYEYPERNYERQAWRARSNTTLQQRTVQALIQATGDDPTDDEPWLMLGDAIEELGDPKDIHIADNIRVWTFASGSARKNTQWDLNVTDPAAVAARVSELPQGPARILSVADFHLMLEERYPNLPISTEGTTWKLEWSPEEYQGLINRGYNGVKEWSFGLLRYNDLWQQYINPLLEASRHVRQDVMNIQDGMQRNERVNDYRLRRRPNVPWGPWTALFYRLSAFEGRINQVLDFFQVCQYLGFEDRLASDGYLDHLGERIAGTIASSKQMPRSFTRRWTEMTRLEEDTRKEVYSGLYSYAGNVLRAARGETVKALLRYRRKGLLRYGHKAEEPTTPPAEPAKKPVPTPAPETAKKPAATSVSGTAKEPAKVVPANLPPEPEEPDSTVTTAPAPAPALPGYGALQGLEQETPAPEGQEDNEHYYERQAQRAVSNTTLQQRTVQALIRATGDDPTDDEPWLMLGDAIEELGDPKDTQIADNIRVWTFASGSARKNTQWNLDVTDPEVVVARVNELPQGPARVLSIADFHLMLEERYPSLPISTEGTTWKLEWSPEEYQTLVNRGYNAVKERSFGLLSFDDLWQQYIDPLQTASRRVRQDALDIRDAWRPYAREDDDQLGNTPWGPWTVLFNKLHAFEGRINQAGYFIQIYRNMDFEERLASGGYLQHLGNNIAATVASNKQIPLGFGRRWAETRRLQEDTRREVYSGLYSYAGNVLRAARGETVKALLRYRRKGFRPTEYTPKLYSVGADKAELRQTSRSGGNLFGGDQALEFARPNRDGTGEGTGAYQFDSPETRLKDLRDRPKHQFSSTQFDITDPDLLARIKELRDDIADEDLAEDGKEDHPHITLLFNLSSDDPRLVEQAVRDWQQVRGKTVVEASLGDIGVFPASDTSVQRGGDYYDVLKLDVNSPDLHDLHQFLAERLPHTETHPTYECHLTLAYITPGLSWLYVGDGLGGQPVVFDTLAFSDRNGNKTLIDLAAPLMGGAKAHKTSNAEGWRCENPPCEWGMFAAGDEGMDMERRPQPPISDQEPWERAHSSRHEEDAQQYARPNSTSHSGLGNDFMFYESAYRRWLTKPDILGARRVRLGYQRNIPADRLAQENDELFRLTREGGSKERNYYHATHPDKQLARCPDGKPMNPATNTCTERAPDGGYPGVDELHIENQDRHVGGQRAGKDWRRTCPDGSAAPPMHGGCHGRQADSWDGVVDKDNAPGWPDYPDYAPVSGLDTRDPDKREKPIVGPAAVNYARMLDKAFHVCPDGSPMPPGTDTCAGRGDVPVGAPESKVAHAPGTDTPAQTHWQRRCPDGSVMPPSVGTCSGREAWVPFTEEERRQQTLSEPPKGPPPEHEWIHDKYPDKLSLPVIPPSRFGKKSLPMVVSVKAQNDEAARHQRAVNVDLIDLPPNVEGTQCANCIFLAKDQPDFCAHPNLRLPLKDGAARMTCKYWWGRGATHPDGSTQPKNYPPAHDPDENARARKADLITLPIGIKNTNCGDCQFQTDNYCHNPQVDQPVTARKCCDEWDHGGAHRQWQTGGAKAFERPHGYNELEVLHPEQDSYASIEGTGLYPPPPPLKKSIAHYISKNG